MDAHAEIRYRTGMQSLFKHLYRTNHPKTTDEEAARHFDDLKLKSLRPDRVQGLISDEYFRSGLNWDQLKSMAEENNIDRSVITDVHETLSQEAKDMAMGLSWNQLSTTVSSLLSDEDQCAVYDNSFAYD